MRIVTSSSLRKPDGYKINNFSSTVEQLVKGFKYSYTQTAIVICQYIKTSGLQSTGKIHSTDYNTR